MKTFLVAFFLCVPYQPVYNEIEWIIVTTIRRRFAERLWYVTLALYSQKLYNVMF